MKFLKNQGPQQRSMMLVMRAREGAVAGFDRSAEDFLKNKRMSGNLDATYNIACGYAQAAGKGDPSKTEMYAKRAVELLQDLYQKKYFTTPRIVNLLVDPDLLPLRQREDFQTFMKQFGNSKKTSVEPPPTVPAKL